MNIQFSALLAQTFPAAAPHSAFFLRFCARTAILGKNDESENDHAEFRSVNLPIFFPPQRGLRQKRRVLHVRSPRRTGRPRRAEKWRQRRRCRRRHGRRDAAARADGQRPWVRLFRARVDREGEKALRLERQRRCADGAERGRGSRKRLCRGARGRLAPHDGPGRARGLVGAQCALWHKAALRALRSRHFLRRKRLCRARQCRQALGARQQAHRQGHGAGPRPL